MLFDCHALALRTNMNAPYKISYVPQRAWKYFSLFTNPFVWIKSFRGRESKIRYLDECPLCIPQLSYSCKYFPWNDSAPRQRVEGRKMRSLIGPCSRDLLTAATKVWKWVWHWSDHEWFCGSMHPFSLNLIGTKWLPPCVQKLRECVLRKALQQGKCKQKGQVIGWYPVCVTPPSNTSINKL